MPRILIILTLTILLASCTTKEPVASYGSFTLDGTTYSFTSLRVDHVGYEHGDSSRFILRLTAYPGTFKCDTVKYSGYGTLLRLFLVATSYDLPVGSRSTALSADSLSYAITITSEGDTTMLTPILDATVAVSAAENDFQTYTLSLTTAAGTSSGSYTGKHTLNCIVDKPACGWIAFDTINANLAAATLYSWGELLSPGTNYYEIIAYSTDARFNDNGKLRSGLQFSLGIMSATDSYPADGTYVVSTDYSPGSVIYGHKIGNANWGTYWAVFSSSSAIGKANILSGTLTTFALQNYASFTFDFTDQLGNTVQASYSGPLN